jgi:PAS domain S-box-containing protein
MVSKTIKLRLTECNYHDLFENASDAMWIQDINGNFTVINRACEKLSGFSRQELMRKNVKEFLFGESLNLAREIGHKLLCGNDLVQPYEQRAVRKDGSIRTMKMTTSLVMIDRKPAGFQHVARDITEERAVAEMVSEITNGSPIPTFVIDRQHIITHWNTAIQSLTGLRSQEMLGSDRHWQAFYLNKRSTMADFIVNGATESDIEVFYQGKYRKSILMEGAYEAEDFYSILGDNGIWLHFTASPIKNYSGEIIAAIETLQDITEEKRMQANMRYYIQLITRAQEEERKRLARELHDDLSSSLLLLIHHLDSVITNSRTKQLALIKETLEELRSQVVEVLQHVRTYVQDLRPQILDDLGLTASLEWMAEDMHKNYSIQTIVKVTGTEVPLSSDVQLHLFRIAQEALSNIRQHATATSVTMTLEYSKETVTMIVSDNGRGFVVPTRLEEMASSGHLGIMGMAERAKLFNGTLEINSSPDHGTRVITTLPM